jgi:hypothetical protein
MSLLAFAKASSQLCTIKAGRREAELFFESAMDQDCASPVGVQNSNSDSQSSPPFGIDFHPINLSKAELVADVSTLR